LPAAEDDWIDHQAHLVDEVVLEQRLHELCAAVDPRVALDLPLPASLLP